MARRPRKTEAKTEEEKGQDAFEQGIVPSDEKVQTLSDFVPPKRGYIDRMMHPQKGMEFKPWNGVDHWICPRCQHKTFNKAEAEKHRC